MLRAVLLAVSTTLTVAAALVEIPAASTRSPLAGQTVALDPGHNGGNARSPGVINRQVPIGQGQTKACNTTGTATIRGYAEAAYTWDVAVRARRVLR